MRYRACPRCQEVLPLEEFFCATNPDPMHTPLCGYCLGVHSRSKKSPSVLDAFVADRSLSRSLRLTRPRKAQRRARLSP
jgi:hypothetical protein